MAVSPIVGGRALKGPAAKMMREMGQMPSPLTVVDHYADLLDGFVLDREDEVLAPAVGLPVLVTDTIMSTPEVRESLGRCLLAFGLELGAKQGLRRQAHLHENGQLPADESGDKPLDEPAPIAPPAPPHAAFPDASASR